MVRGKRAEGGKEKKTEGGGLKRERRKRREERITDEVKCLFTAAKIVSCFSEKR